MQWQDSRTRRPGAYTTRGIQDAPRGRSRDEVCELWLVRSLARILGRQFLEEVERLVVLVRGQVSLALAPQQKGKVIVEPG